MKHILILAVALALTAKGHAQEGMEAILQQIARNNKALQANTQLIASQKLESKATNNLANPTLSYSHLWDSDDKNITVGELVISQSFDFPSLYATRNRVSRLKSTALDAQSAAVRQQVLLQAQQLCLDIVLLHQQQQLLDERLKNAEELAQMYAERLKTGDANALETNKINLELLNVRTESRTNATTLQNKLKELTALNGNLPLAPGRPQPEPAMPGPEALGLTDYTPTPLPADFTPVLNELLAADPALQALQHESAAARKQVSVSKQGWLPQLELGYRRNTETRHPLNGIVVGFSFPLFENRHQVKMAKSQALNVDYQKEDALLQASSALWQLYDEARSLQQSIDEYNDTFARQRDLSLLRKALEGGEISMIEYFVEVSVVYQSKANLLLLENQYQKVMAQMYKSRL
ncbi:TolC family protein [Bacteroides sp. ET71]|uniref:TolC family protein n=1 Tax=Bacteroides sp. ET71 TaxID=2939421 RepID=UPI00201257C6|nr:TolC family protein [Bacteroides sp. ET71]MCL1615925.1 TolC family protein [Bacteroides sp. ET71]